MDKSTHERIELWQPVIKTSNGKYIAVLSDDSLDRDDEIVGKQALKGIMDNDGYTAMLLNHKNDVMGQIGEWVNKRIETTGEHTAFVAEPKFYMSNPNAKIIKGCLDEGAQYGISIGAIPKSYEYVEKSGRKIKMYTNLELLEASWVAIPSNRHGMATAVAKMFINTEGKMEDKMFTQEELDTAIEKGNSVEKENIIELEKSHTESVEKIEAGHKDAVEKIASEHVEAVEKMTSEHKAEIEKLNEQMTKDSTELDELRKMSVMKGDNSTEEGDDAAKEKAEAEKALADGKIPVVTK